MALTADNIIKIMQKAKELGLLEELKPVPIDSQDPEEFFKNMSSLDMPSDLDLLYWATPYYDELQAQKLEKQERLKDEALEREHG